VIINIEHSIIEEKSFLFIGCVFYGDPFHSAKEWTIENEIGKLWERYGNLISKNYRALKRNLVNLNIGYEIHIEPEEYIETKNYFVFVGTEIKDYNDVPLEMFIKVLPKIKYLFFTAKAMDLDVLPPEISQEQSALIFPRPPVLCPGCPHRATFYALNKSIPRRHRLVSTDIGCYTLGVAPPLSAGNVTICMGSSLGIGSGVAHSPGLKDPVVAIIGDSTFWHTGLPGLVNAVYNRSKLLLLVVDNSATAMTGFQPNPSSFTSHSQVETLAIEEAARGVGVEFVATIDAFNPKESIKVIKEAVKKEGVSVIVSKGECNIQFVRREGLPENKYYIEADRCVGCYACVNMIACPAIIWSDRTTTEEGKPIPTIDQSLCTRCGLCASVCPYGVIVTKIESETN